MCNKSLEHSLYLNAYKSMDMLFGRGVVCVEIVDSVVLKINSNSAAVVREARNLRHILVAQRGFSLKQ